MPQTFRKISSATITVANTKFVTFSSIPQTFTDIYIKIVARATTSSGGWFYTRTQINGTSTASSIGYDLYGSTGSGSAALAAFRDVTTYIYPGYAAGDSILAGVYAVGELYVPNYSSSSALKVFRGNLGGVHNTSTWVNYCAGAIPSSSAVTSLFIESPSYNWEVGTTMDLYGILKA